MASKEKVQGKSNQKKFEKGLIDVYQNQFEK